MPRQSHILRELFPRSLQQVEEILWTAKSKLEMRCTLKSLSETQVVLEVENDVPEVGTPGIVWLPYFRIFPVVVTASTDHGFTAEFDGLDDVMKKSLDFFLESRETGTQQRRPGWVVRTLYKTVYSIEQRMKGIENRTFLPQDYPWSLDFENHYASIRREVDNIFNNVDVGSIPLGVDQFPKAHSVLVAQQGKVEEEAKQLLPTLAQVVGNVPSLANAELSILAPGAELRLHKSAFRCFLRMHLGIIIPKGDVCLELEGERLEWQEGKVMIFDDFYPHRAWNKTEHTRVILMVDLFRPMPKWQKYFLRFAQQYAIPRLPTIPKEWLSW
ncbi:aspartyl/asparaginyl beta-hydroxylase domain-containing protein [Marinibactrum halimedae]|uniref:Aspartyl/asparaginy/proline hydroxylase domain-containing protein n=1 Tax=Marinibactrum halimedae TaxID=1444977 RepID=A0AA37WNZ2_9GAMM|nr:aspartyl/asparaginyl beta-hydroxylase domain-containing protein [Marinibactrum halimedae]MCD9458492.1 aspartyl/asparaginyl beta-hydroxylase domain-containing protein [Marinibactrum halimedae]GLS26646.1 hypothetical protein GCM10007877_23620 [Marinibactrum halimedae]